MNQLLIALSKYGKVSIYNNKISLITQPIILRGFKLGRFRIIWDNYRSSLTVFALEPRGYHGAGHPHIQDQMICLGDNYWIFDRFREGELEEAFSAVITVLRTETQDDYIEFEDMTEIFCIVCGELVDKPYSKCKECRGIFCTECTVECTNERCGECNECHEYLKQNRMFK